MVQVRYLICIIIVNIFFPAQIFQDTLPGNFKVVTFHFEVLYHLVFCSAPGDRQDTKAQCVRNWENKDAWLQATVSKRKLQARVDNADESLIYSNCPGWNLNSTGRTVQNAAC